MANFYSVLLTVVTIFAGLIWLVDARFLKPKRQQRIGDEERRLQQTLDEDARQRLAPQGNVAEFAQSVFPILFVILILRSFFYEPFRIPSASMMPTLLEGDFILVEKFSYSLRDPIWRHELLELAEPERGDIAVFKYPPEPSLDFIKRVVGLPGDRIIYRNKTLYIEPSCETEVQNECPPLQVIERNMTRSDAFYFNGATPLQRFEEKLGATSHATLVDPTVGGRERYYFQQQGTARDEWLVPEGAYFVMGDNRDNSEDSRYWGFVPEENLVGRAEFIWMSFEMDRPASSWLPTWIPSGIRWQRLGGVE
ncbi:signal peptidase I [Pseudidiomarina terrestris]|uniref:Signal peptidase I n=1 Tax=Pseudidiomarina terrestris TaxID=2820060 RepID=A0AAW7QV16_9GAMM|nr:MULTISPECIES: signal peptidase I [unclassified Pseudidiomarina]MDN7123584.1 signal peptidase I [Pseudidiomarina sp. 1APP75-32.1]MDN7126626.1 signal peptidase I [Pseudidiomarina sp. 1APR75-33.1]MDN7128692.1 signal peptidase I [Pseudidiomarina sp. 1APR75-15]MDN7135049.1 signal peptidase I [Pseudidiomarina sp. 1ASP75-5]MDN7137720.1 signal peptidase I [Pseudidiomarina sp. 1ASP75-14]